MEPLSRIFVAGSDTLIGGALRRQLVDQGYERLVEEDGHPDLTNATEVDAFFAASRPEYVFVAAGKSGGIAANQRYPADLIRDNLLVASHVIESARRHGVTKLLYLASSCSYPKHAPQPMRVESLLTGPLEPTNEAYAIAKISGIKLCEAYSRQFGVRFIAAIPADAFGPGDHFDPVDSHVVAALIRRMHEARLTGAKHIDIWGSGNQRRELIFVDEVAGACIHVMRHYAGTATLNIGGGADVSIRDLACAVREVVGYTGELRFDTSRPDGMPVKTLDSTVLRELGWRSAMDLREGLSRTYEWFLRHQDRVPTRAGL